MDIRINECTALSTLLRCTTTKLQKLNLLGNNNIDDDGIELLLPALRGHTLQELYLGHNRSITIKGWKKVSTLLEMPDTNLETLNISFNDVGDNEARIFANALANNTTLKTLNIASNNIGDEGALVFAKICALVNNSTLETLVLHGNGIITTEGWAPFSNLLCDTSSVNRTYLSNHTLTHLGDTDESMRDSFIPFHLFLNKETSDKGKVAMKKILEHHYHFNMQPFFEWEFKVLPIMINWVEKATATAINPPGTFARYSQKINKMRLSAIYAISSRRSLCYISKP